MEKETLNSQDLSNPSGRTVRKRKFSGVVVGDTMDKTIIVRVDRVKTHSKYHKQFTAAKKYKVHDPQNKYHRGDKVEFIECRPISKNKRWRVIY